MAVSNRVRLSVSARVSPQLPQLAMKLTSRLARSVLNLSGRKRPQAVTSVPRSYPAFYSGLLVTFSGIRHRGLSGLLDR